MRLPEYRAAAESLVEWGQMLYTRGLLAAREGNLSVRVGPGQFAITPAGSCKGRLTARQILLVNERGRVLAGQGQPSSETALHLGIYRHRADACAVVHAHPPVATGFAAAGRALEAPVLPELLVELGGVPLAPFAAPGSQELFESVRPLIARHEVLLLASHGAVAFSTLGLEDAALRMEQLEQAARILLTAHLLGGARPLDPTWLRQLARS
ncbi:MAG: class II aldolase/adducin family protein [Calditrichaeota bacterium]|nr:class II aldolase/adducin family protein [Candidatus Cloacimonadota bacterium]MCA9786521.1 class II aldolase/adducin family protein [Candidatus Cloacimonadota bacterium]MCB1045651.1 class II aldolase/adducin family protein [Calditrichota bacterium]MCB9474633.1 class II aldolase/adducin family protein [Candidatus Delongbacteria bacterium]